MAGFWTLTRLILRRDRVKLPIWIGSIVLSLLAMVPMLKDIYGDSGSLAVLHQTFGTNPAGLFLTGPMDAPTFGALMTIETLLWWGLAIAFMNTLFIIRHTRHNEEIGAQELILSGRVHRRTGLFSALFVAFLANLIMAIFIGAGMSLVSDSWSAQSGWLYGLSLGLFGWVWAVIAALVVQLVESGRSANGILAGLIGLTFILRGIGDFLGTTNAEGLVEPTWISTLSPFGWLQATRALTFPEWTPLSFPVICTIILIPIAIWLLDIRDVGAGILPARKGRARARRWLTTNLGLAWRLQRAIFTGWLIGVIVMVITIGALVPQMASVYQSSDNMKALIVAMGGQGALIPTFLSAMLSVIVLMVLAYAIQALSKLRGEEASGHLESILATKTSRFRWLVSHGSIILIGSVIMLTLAGALLAGAVTIWSNYEASIGEYILAGLSYFPVVGLFVGLYVLLFGLLPRTASLVTWLYFGFVTFALWIAPMLKLDQWIMNLSVMSHLAAAPAEAIKWQPLLVLSVAALGGLFAGIAAFRRRDIQG